MKTLDMKYLVESKLNELNRIGDRIFDSKDVLDALNEAQNQIFMDNYLNRREDELFNRIVNKVIKNYSTSTTTTSTSNLLNGVFVTLPNNFLFSLKEDVYLSKNGVSSYAKVKPITYDYYTINKDNPYKKPYKDLVWRLVIEPEDKSVLKHELILPSGYTLESYNMRYLSTIPDLTFTSVNESIITESLHFDIVNRATSLLIGRFQPKERELKKDE
jgi:hypothetical protein